MTHVCHLWYQMRCLDAKMHTFDIFLCSPSFLTKISQNWKFLIFGHFSNFFKIAKKCHFWPFSSKFLIGLYGRYMSSMVSIEMFRHQKTHFWSIFKLIIICWFYIILLRDCIFWQFLKSLSVSSTLSVSHRNFWLQKYSQNVE